MIGCSFLLASITLYLILTSQINKVKSAKSQLVYIPEIPEIIPVSVKLPIRGDPERWKDRMAEQQNGRLTKQWKNHPNPKRRNRENAENPPKSKKDRITEMAEQLRIYRDFKRGNDRKSPKILKEGNTTIKPSIFWVWIWESDKRHVVCETSSLCKIISFVVKNLLSFRLLLLILV